MAQTHTDIVGAVAGRDEPVVPEGILHKCRALTVRPIRRFAHARAADGNGPRVERALVSGVAILHVHVQRGRKFLTARGLVSHDKQIGVADSHTGNESGGPMRMTGRFLGGEGALHELDQFISLRNGDEGSDRMDRDAVVRG